MERRILQPYGGAPCLPCGATAVPLLRRGRLLAPLRRSRSLVLAAAGVFLEFAWLAVAAWSSHGGQRRPRGSRARAA